jgi:hypothetical protein
MLRVLVSTDERNAYVVVVVLLSPFRERGVLRRCLSIIQLAGTYYNSDYASLVIVKCYASLGMAAPLLKAKAKAKLSEMHYYDTVSRTDCTVLRKRK